MNYLHHSGFTLALAIALHDIPEGISIAIPLKSGGISKFNSMLLTAFSGITTGIGAFLGSIIGYFSPVLIGISLSFAAGAMLYVVSCEILPESKKLYYGKLSSFGYMFGIIMGIVVTLL